MGAVPQPATIFAHARLLPAAHRSMSAHPFLAGLRHSPDYLLQNLDLVNRRGLVVHINENIYRQASFLDERMFTPHTQGAWFPLELLFEATRELTPPQAPHYIFHTGHCGSTLISRLLGELPRAFSLREPLTLLALAMMQRELDMPGTALDGDAWRRLLHLSLQLLSRTYRKDDRPLIKLTSGAGNLAEMLLARNRESRAVLLYLPLETWLATMLRAEETRENGRAYAAAWLADFHRLTGRTDIRQGTLNDAQQFSLNWLTELLCFKRTRDAAPGRTRLLDFETFLAAPAEQLEILADFLELDTSRNQAEVLVNGPWMQCYAKIPSQRFDREMRRRELDEARQRLAAEIRAGLTWAESLCRETPVLAPLAVHLHTH